MVKSLVGIHVTINSELDEDILLTYTNIVYYDSGFLKRSLMLCGRF